MAHAAARRSRDHVKKSIEANMTVLKQTPFMLLRDGKSQLDPARPC